MARTFNGTSDRITVSAGAWDGFAGELTFAAIVKLGSDTAGYRSILGLKDGAGNGWDFSIQNTQLVMWLDDEDGGAFSVPSYITVAMGWVLVAVTHGSGAATPRFHRYRFDTDAWDHTDHSQTTTQTTPATGASLDIGSWGAGQYFTGDIAIVGAWQSNFSDGVIERLPWTLQQWVQPTSEKSVWILDQSETTQSVADACGTSHQSSISGTSISTSSVPVWNYGSPLILTTRTQDVVEPYNTQAQYSSAVLADSPAAYYKLDESSGLPQDSSGNARHMTGVVGTPDYQYSSPFSGAYGIRYQSSEIHYLSVYSTITDNFTFEFWANSLNTGIFVCGNGDAGGTPPGITVDTNMLVDTPSSSTGPKVSGWFHCAVIRRSTTWEYYLNGELHSTGGTTAPTTPSGNFFIAGSSKVDGIIVSNLSYYTTALSAARIKAHYVAAMAIPVAPTTTYAEEVLADSPLAFYKLDEASGLPQDSSGNGNHMTDVVGTPEYQIAGPFSNSYGIKYLTTTNEQHFQNADITDAVDNITFEFWFYLLAANGGISVGNSSNGLAVVISGAVLQVRAAGSTLSTGHTMPTLSWNHVAVIRRSTTWEVYFNGELWSNNIGTTTPTTPASIGLTIGKHKQTTSYDPDIVFSNVAFFTTALSAERIKAHYDAAVGQIDQTILIPRTTMTIS